MMEAPARLRRATTSASCAAGSTSPAALPPVSGRPATAIRSFTMTGTPARMPEPCAGTESASHVKAFHCGCAIARASASRASVRSAVPKWSATPSAGSTAVATARYGGHAGAAIERKRASSGALISSRRSQAPARSPWP